MTTPKLALIPSAYKAGKLYSPLPTNGDGDFTFTRNSGATRVNKAGLIENVGESLGSQEVTNGSFDTDTDWTKQNGSTISGGVATVIANGSVTSTGANRGVQQDNVFVAGNTYDITFTVRQTVGSGIFQISNGFTLLFDATVTSELTTYTIRRIAGTVNAADDILCIGGRTVSDEFEVSDISVKEVLTEVNIPRLDYSDGGCPSLLLEPQRTNNITNSESLSNASWQKFNSGLATTPIITDNYAISPSGEMNASRLQMSLGGGTTSSDRAFVRQSLTSQTDYYFSVYLKSTNGAEQKLNWHFGSDDFLITVTDEWQRFELTRSGVATTWAGIGLRGNLVSVLGIDDSVDILVYGFQVEQGSNATSCIPTNGSIVTRAADLCFDSMLDNPVLTSDDWTLFFDVDCSEVGSNNKRISLVGSTLDDKLELNYNANSNRFSFTTRNGGAATNYKQLVTTERAKIAMVSTADGYDFYANGAFVASGTDGRFDASTMRRLSFDQGGTGSLPFEGKVYGLRYYDEAITSEEAITLTT